MDHHTPTPSSSDDDQESTQSWTTSFRTQSDPFVDAGEDTASAVHLRLQSQGRRKSTIIQGLDGRLDQQRLTSLLKKEFHCTGAVVNHPVYGQVITLTGAHSIGLKDFLVKNRIASVNNIINHGV
jgi:translation initiation factor SUI1